MNIEQSGPAEIIYTRCVHCNESLDHLKTLKGAIASHTRWCSKSPIVIAIKNKTKTCPTCGDSFKGRRKYCSSHCIPPVSDITRKTISEKRKAFLKENPEKHVWKSHSKFISIPCEKIKDRLSELGISYVSEYRPLTDRAFSIDIAFPDMKLGIEINGNQHYNRNGTLSEYYQRRHDIITAAGWTLIELHYTAVFGDIHFLLDAVFNRIQPDYTAYFLNRNAKKVSVINAKIEKKKQAEDAIDRRKLEILNSGIKFGEWGWITQLAGIIKISPQCLSRWINRHMPELKVTTLTSIPESGGDSR